MPSINSLFLKKLKEDFTTYKCLIETGTNNGDTIFALEPFFNKLYTIEVSQEYYTRTKNRYRGNKIEFILGDSSEIFKNILPKINEKCIFFLDGHWSGGDTGRSNKDCPLNEEITHINNLFNNEAIIIIDDFRLFGLDMSSGKLGENWKDINKTNLLNILNSRIKDVYHLDSDLASDDRLIIHISNK